MADIRSSQIQKDRPISEEDLQKLRILLGKIGYGSVTLIIQNGKVIQIEKNEKLRLK